MHNRTLLISCQANSNMRLLKQSGRYYHKTRNFGIAKLWRNLSLKNFDERNVDEILVKSAYFILYCSTFIRNKLFEGAYFAWWLYFVRLKLTPICQICQSFWCYGIMLH